MWVEVLALDSLATWVLISVDGREGWVYGQYVRGIEFTADVTLSDSDADALATDPASVRYYSIALRTSPGNETDNDLDGRLNPYLYSATGLVYCFDVDGYTDRQNYAGGGIAVYLFYGETPGVVFVASEAEINSVGIPGVPTVIRSESGFTLYRLPDGAFEMTGPSIDGGLFRFRWFGCSVNHTTVSQ